MMTIPDSTFAVLYRWKLVSGLEPNFVESWKTITDTLTREFDSAGSSLHKAEDSTWVAYARWPDRATWEKAVVKSAEGLAAMRAMQEAIERRFDPLLLETVFERVAVRANDPETA